ncbi:hypothetical protein IT418_03400 [bacterium]|nr:hypothetical protein [bacterium]
MRKSTFKNFSTELSHYQGANNYAKWLAFLEELGIYADYNWDIPTMQYDLVKSDKAWREFTAHPEREPFQISIPEWRTWDTNQVYQRTLEVLQFSIVLTKEKGIDKEIQSQIKLSLSQIIKGILHSRYNKDFMTIKDTYLAITPEMRSRGNMYITEVQKANFEYNCLLTAQELKKNSTEIKRTLLEVCQHDLARLSEYVFTCQFSDEFKNIFSTYRKIAQSDFTLSDLRIRLGFKIWKELYDHGITIDVYLELLGYPNAKTTKKRLNDVLYNKKITKEIHQHLKYERPNSYKQLKKYGFVSQIDITQEEAKIYEYPKKLRTERQTIEMIDRCKNIIKRYFPISSEESPRQLLFNALHPFAVKRAYQSQTQNRNKQVVNITVMTPTTDSEHDYLETLAHETTHAIHSIILNRGADFGILTRQQVGQVPTGVLEDFSQLVEGQFKNSSEKQVISKPGKYFASLSQSTSSRWQAPYGLIQIEIREYFEKLFKENVTEITGEMLLALRTKYIQKMYKWWDKQLGFQQTTVDPFMWFSPIAPYDGLVYMKRFILPEKIGKLGTKKEKLSMKEAFTKRFGEKWIDTQDARILLYWLLLETGRNHATENYGELILTKDISQCLEELQKIGIDAIEFTQKQSTSQNNLW